MATEKPEHEEMSEMSEHLSNTMVEALRRVANDLKRTELLARNFRLLRIAADDKSNAESFEILADALKDIQTGIGMVLSKEAEPAEEAEPEGKVPHEWPYVCPHCKSMNVSSFPDGFESYQFTCACCKAQWRAGRRSQNEAWVELPM